MAEITAPAKTGKRKTQAPRIDLTPMVDLGFLLITFFMFTTTLAQHKVLQVNMPSTDHPDNPISFIAEATITLMPTAAHRVAYYSGELKDAAQIKIAAIRELRNVVLHKKEQAAALPSGYSKEAHKLHVIIKPNDDCSYADVVAILDEMTITGVPYYALVDITAEEKEMIKK